MSAEVGISITNVCRDLPKIIDKFYTERGILSWKIKVSPATPVSLDMKIYLSMTGWLVGLTVGYLGVPCFLFILVGFGAEMGKESV